MLFSRVIGGKNTCQYSFIVTYTFRADQTYISLSMNNWWNTFFFKTVFAQFSVIWSKWTSKADVSKMNSRQFTITDLIKIGCYIKFRIFSVLMVEAMIQRFLFEVFQQLPTNHLPACPSKAWTEMERKNFILSLYTSSSHKSILYFCGILQCST